jgi:hypothetical protein
LLRRYRLCPTCDHLYDPIDRASATGGVQVVGVLPLSPPNNERACTGRAQAADIDEDMREYVVEMVSGILEDADGATPDVQEELKEAVGPILGTGCWLHFQEQQQWSPCARAVAEQS